MKLLWILASVLLLGQNQAFANTIENRNKAQVTTADLTEEVQELMSQISASDDTELQREAKALIAQYLIEASLYDSDKADDGSPGRIGDLTPIPYGKHHYNHHDWWHQQSAIVAAGPQPAVKAPEVAAVAAPVPAVAPVAVNQVRLDPVTQAPVAVPPVTAAPVKVSGDAAVPIGSPPAPTAAPIPILAPAAAPAAPVQPAPVPVAAPPATTPVPPITAPTVDPVHHLNQVNKILGNVANGNIVGIVDESLAIRAPPPVRNLVTGILKVVFCNPIDRLLRRCSQNQIDANRNSVKGR